jgi:hypothetical protein
MAESAVTLAPGLPAAAKQTVMDEPGTKWTRTGWMHFLLAFVAFGSVLAAALVLGAVVSGQGRWHELAPVSETLGYAMTACLALFGLAQTVPALKAWFGAIEEGTARRSPRHTHPSAGASVNWLVYRS